MATVSNWTAPIIGAVIAAALVFWVNDVTMVQRQMIQKVADIGANMEAHFDGHPGRVEDQVRDLHEGQVELRAELRSIHRDVERITKALHVDRPDG